MHTLTDRELGYDLEPQEVVDLAIQIANHLKEKGFFKGFHISVEEIGPEYSEGPYASVNPGYSLLGVGILSSSTKLMDDEYGSEMVYADKGSTSCKDIQTLIKQGEELVDLLHAAMPDASVSTEFPTIPTPSQPIPRTDYNVFYTYNDQIFYAHVPNEEYADDMVKYLVDKGFEKVHKSLCKD